MGLEKDTIRVLSVSEPDEDGMCNMEIEFLDEAFQKRIEIYAKNAAMTVEEYIVEALYNLVEKEKENKSSKKD